MGTFRILGLSSAQLAALTTCAALACGGPATPVKSAPPGAAAKSAVPVEMEPTTLAPTPVPTMSADPLIDAHGGFAFHLVAEDDGSLATLPDVVLMATAGGRFAYRNGGLYRWQESSTPAGIPFCQLPHYKGKVSDVVAAEVGKTLLVGRGYELFAIDSASGRVRAQRTLPGRLATMKVHQSGAILATLSKWKTLPGQLLRIDPASLEIVWSVDQISSYPIPSDAGFAYGIEGRGDKTSFVAVNIETGKIERRLDSGGMLESELHQAGNVIRYLTGAFTRRRDDGRRDYASLSFEAIDIGTWKRTNLALDRHKPSFGGVFSDLVPLLGPGGDLGMSLVATAGGKGELIKLGTTVETVSFAETESIRGGGHMVQVAGSVVLAVDQRLHIFDVVGNAHRAVIELPEKVDALVVTGRDLMVGTKSRVYRFRAGRADPGKQLDYIRANPWEFGDATRLHDGKPETSWLFVGDRARVDVVFRAPVLVSQAFVRGTRRRNGTLHVTRTSVSTDEFGGHASPTRRRSGQDPRSSPREVNGQLALLAQATIARRISIDFTCTCDISVCPQRQRAACAIAELDFGEAASK